MKTRSLLAAVALTLAALVGAPAVALADTATPTRGTPDNCPRLPWGTPGCEDHLGAQIRRDLVAAKWRDPVEFSDWELGRLAAGWCFESATPPELRWQVITISAAVKQVAVPNRCG